MTTTAKTYEDRLAREKTTRRAMMDAARTEIAAAMAKLHKEEWTGLPPSEETDRFFRIQRTRDGLTLCLTAPTYPPTESWSIYADRITVATSPETITVSLSQHSTREEKTRISVSRTKPAAQIARDITRRLLPLAETLAGRACEARAKEIENANWRAVVIHRLTHACPLPLEPVGTGEDNLRHWGETHIHIELRTYGRKAKVEIDDIDIDTAENILAALKK